MNHVLVNKRCAIWEAAKLFLGHGVDELVVLILNEFLEVLNRIYLIVEGIERGFDNRCVSPKMQLAKNCSWVTLSRTVWTHTCGSIAGMCLRCTRVRSPLNAIFL